MKLCFKPKKQGALALIEVLIIVVLILIITVQLYRVIDAARNAEEVQSLR